MQKEEFMNFVGKIYEEMLIENDRNIQKFIGVKKNGGFFGVIMVVIFL